MGWERVLKKDMTSDDNPSSGSSRPRILIVDDEIPITKTLEQYLEMEGYKPLIANDAEQALNIYHAQKPDVIVTDIRMPGKSGIELLADIRKTDAETEIIVVTGHGDLESAIEAIKLKASDFILKPIDFEVLLLTIERSLDRNKLRQKVADYTHELESLVKQVETSRNFLEAVFQNSPNALITYDLNNIITSWNNEAEAITGYSAEEAVGNTIEQVLKLDPILFDMGVDGDENKPSNSVSQLLSKDRQLHYINRNASNILNQQGEVIGGIESFIDLTEQIKAERLLEKRYLQVQTINDISKMVSTENDLGKLSDYVLESLHKSFFESSLLSIFYYRRANDALVLESLTGQGLDSLDDRTKIGRKYSADKGIIGKVFRSGKTLIVDNVPTTTDYFRNTLSEAFSAFAFPIRSKKHIYGILNIENAERVKLDESDHFMLETISEFLGISAERIQLLERITHQNTLLEDQAEDLRKALRQVKSQNATIEKQNKRLIQDLKKAGEFQKSLLPDTLPEYENVRFAATYIPSSQLGGDIYDIFEIDDQLVGIILADASGHGVAAAMLSAMFKMTLQKYASEILDPAQVMARLNSDFCQVLQMGEFFTAFYAILNRSTGRFVYANAAHPRPLLYDYEQGTVSDLDTNGFLLGVMEENITYEQRELVLGPRSRIVIYTDGVNEAANSKGKMYGDNRVRMRLMERAADTAGNYISALQSDLKKFTGSDVFEDDVTVLVTDFNTGKFQE